MVIGVEGDALVPKPGNPAPKQGGGFHFPWVDAAGALFEGFDTEIVGPLAKLGGGELAEEIAEEWGEVGAGIAGDEGLQGLAVGEIETTIAGDEKLAADGAFGLENGNAGTGERADFGSAEAGRTAANDGDVGGRKHAGGWGGMGGEGKDGR